MEEFDSRKRQKIYKDVIEAIKNIIVDSELQPGDKIPSQTDLSTKLGVSSRSVREAIKTLEARGILETHHGKGVYVRSTNLDCFLEILSDSLLLNPSNSRKVLIELTYVRNIIESNVIHDVAKRPTGELLKKLIEVLDDMEQAIDSNNIEKYNLLDIRFHKILIGASGNDILISLYKYLSNLLQASVDHTAYVEGTLRNGYQDHHHMVEALIARKPEKAMKIMSQHIAKTKQKLDSMADQELIAPTFIYPFSEETTTGPSSDTGKA